MESKPPAAWLSRKDGHVSVPEFCKYFIHKGGGWGRTAGRKMQAVLKEFTLAVDKGAGRRCSVASSVMGTQSSQNSCVSKKWRLLGFEGFYRGNIHLKIHVIPTYTKECEQSFALFLVVN